MHKRFRFLMMFVFPCLITSFLAAGEIPVYTYRIVNTFPHDSEAYTQGLVYDNGYLFEGTGLRGQSSLRKVDIETGTLMQLYELPRQYFGEGITIFGDKIIQLTWQSNVCFVYDKDRFILIDKFYYSSEGWGITNDRKRLIMSDGTSTLYFLDPETFQEVSRVEVYDNNGPVTQLNELEFIHEEIFANVWASDRIARIDPLTGKVTGWIDLTGLLGPAERMPKTDVLNGIAFDAKNDRLFVTGKFWPKLFEIELILQQN